MIGIITRTEYDHGKYTTISLDRESTNGNGIYRCYLDGTGHVEWTKNEQNSLEVIINQLIGKNHIYIFEDYKEFGLWLAKEGASNLND